VSLSSNYEFLLDEATNMLSSGGLETCKVLDYGCGKGALVEEGLSTDKGLLGERIREIVDQKIPFPDAFFDLVVSNQVFEHIPNLAPVIAEIERVLKPGGRVLCITPYLGAYREGHCEIPFAHRFKAESKSQYCWLYMFKLFGFGRRKHVKNPDTWARFFSTWLKENTYYKSFEDMDGLFNAHFSDVKHIEEDYLEFRLKSIHKHTLSRVAKAPVIRVLSRWFVRKFGSLVILAQKK